MTRSALLGSILVPDIGLPCPADVDLGFLQYWMRTIVRFSGHPAALTLQEHSRLAQGIAMQRGMSPEAIEWALLHDYHECATGDHIRPLQLAAGFRDSLSALQLRWDAAICGALGIEPPSDKARAEVAVADSIAMAAEWMFALGRPFVDVGLSAEYEEMAREAEDLIWTTVGSERADDILMARMACGRC